MRHILEKAGKIAAALRAQPSDPQVVTPTQYIVCVTFENWSNFFASLKLQRIIS